MTDPKNGRKALVRLLLVDDEEGFVDILAKRIRRRNIDVTAAYSGSEAIRALRQSEFDVAVLDLKMEDIDGLEVMKVFKIMDPLMEVIMLTGHGSAEAARQGMAMGAFDYLTKPCELEALLEKIRAAHAHRMRAGAKRSEPEGSRMKGET